MGQLTFSVVIPAYNEEMYLPRTLAAIRHAADRLGEEVKVVIGDNMSIDRTAEVAEERGAKVVRGSSGVVSRPCGTKRQPRPRAVTLRLSMPTT